MAPVRRSFCYLVAMLVVVFFTITHLASFANNQQPEHEMLSFSIQVLNAEGEPLVGAEIVPWALRSPHGHGHWSPEGYGRSEPPHIKTSSNGKAKIPYPRYTLPEERVRTTEVTLSVDHPNHAHIQYEFVDVPTEKAVHSVNLEQGAPVKIVPLQNGKPAPLEGLYALWSDGRSWQSGAKLSTTADGALRIPPMPAGKGQVLIARLDGEHVTHFSSIIQLELENGQTQHRRVELQPAARLEGKLSDNVPRPVTNGRLKVQSLPRKRASLGNSFEWLTWAPIAEDGTFVIESWPAGEAAQVIALSDRYIAKSARVPKVIEKEVGDVGSFRGPQVFLPTDFKNTLEVEMTPLVGCDIQTVDDSGSALAGVKVSSYPNVSWWNGGNQAYCTSLVRGACLLKERDYYSCVDDAYSFPFKTTTDDNGQGTLYLPAGKQVLSAKHQKYELPIVRGRRHRRIQLSAGKRNSAKLVLQPKGKEYLGEWDKLAGLLFGCTGEECQRLLEDPTLRNKMEKVRLQLDQAEDPTDPKLLKNIYQDISAAFDELGDEQEVTKWRRKAEEQAEELKSPSD